MTAYPLGYDSLSTKLCHMTSHVILATTLLQALLSAIPTQHAVRWCALSVVIHDSHTFLALDVSWVLPGTVWSQLQALNEQCHAFAFDILFQPLRKKLERVPHLQVNLPLVSVLMFLNEVGVACAGVEWHNESTG